MWFYTTCLNLSRSHFLSLYGAHQCFIVQYTDSEKSTVVQSGFVNHFVYFTDFPICLLSSHNLFIHLFTVTALSCGRLQTHTQTFTPTFPPTARLEATLNLSMSSDCGRKLEHLQKTQGEHADNRPSQTTGPDPQATMQPLCHPRCCPAKANV